MEDTYDNYKENSSLERTFHHYYKLLDAVYNLREYNGKETMDLLEKFVENMFEKMIRQTIGKILGKDPEEVTKEEIHLATIATRHVENYDEETGIRTHSVIHLSDDEFKERVPKMYKNLEEGMDLDKACLYSFHTKRDDLVNNKSNDVKEINGQEKLFIADLACKLNKMSLNKDGFDHTPEATKAYDRKVYRLCIASLFEIDPKIIPDKYVDYVINGKLDPKNGTRMVFNDSDILKEKADLVDVWQRDYDLINAQNEVREEAFAGFSR